MKDLLLTLSVLFLFSCVPPQKLKELELEHKDVKTELLNQKKSNQNLILENTELLSNIEHLKKTIFNLGNDTLTTSELLRQTQKSYDDLNETYQLLLTKSNRLLAENAEENRVLLEKLELLKLELQVKEDSLALENQRLNNLQLELELSQKELELRESRVNELENIINSKDSLMLVLKNKVANALLVFKDKGLTIEERDGKVYVSLDNSLLFASGQWEVDKEGKKAIKKIGEVLEEYQDIHVLIEGHTDNVPYSGNGFIKNNWDLSVIRATAIVNILMENKNIKPERITAAGRGKYNPIDSNETEEGRKKNRRIEIILTPNLGELVDFINEVK